MKLKTLAMLGRKEIRYKALIVIIIIAILATVFIAKDNITGKWFDRERHSFSFSATGLSDGSGNTIDIRGSGKFSPVGMTGGAYFHDVWMKASGQVTFKAAGTKEIGTRWKAEDRGFYGFQEIDPFLNITARITGTRPAWSGGTIKISLNEGSEPSTGSVTVYAGQSTYTGKGNVVVTFNYITRP
ncbi:TPA: hypothetical protein H1016_00660 [archaeon]|uniref:Uncharacterized protein n=1 Tax=Candidatus Naiadarchaeum limnaeum TaxID=2756139 RepID=A0A832UZ93_9ARCH|nr:hypothetical protein [Candidatus Naiadarchaeum limnaeum]